MAQKRLADRTFGLAFAAVFGAIAAIVWLLSGRVVHWSVAISMALLILALAAPGVLMPLNRIWAWLAQRIGFATNHLLLGLFFYLVIIPFGIAARLFGMSTLRKRPDRSVGSYWDPVERQATAETYSDMF